MNQEAPAPSGAGEEVTSTDSKKKRLAVAQKEPLSEVRRIEGAGRIFWISHPAKTASVVKGLSRLIRLDGGRRRSRLRP